MNEQIASVIGFWVLVIGIIILILNWTSRERRVTTTISGTMLVGVGLALLLLIR